MNCAHGPNTEHNQPVTITRLVLVVMLIAVFMIAARVWLRIRRAERRRR